MEILSPQPPRPRRPAFRFGGLPACLMLAALGGAAAPLLCLAVALTSYGAPLAASLGLIGVALAGAGFGAYVARGTARPLERLSHRLDAAIWAQEGPPVSAPRDWAARLIFGVDLLLERLEERRAAHRPARLDDPLTGLSNRIDLMRRGRDEIARARRSGAALSLALIEIEDFRRFAEDAGPVAAELALRRCAEMLGPALRAYDVIGRWDDAVFAVILPESEIEYAAAAMRRLRESTRAARLVVHEDKALSVVSGVAVLHPQDATIADIAPRAARALSRARSGRGDGVECAPGPRKRPAHIVPV